MRRNKKSLDIEAFLFERDHCPVVPSSGTMGAGVGVGTGSPLISDIRPMKMPSHMRSMNTSSWRLA